MSLWKQVYEYNDIMSEFQHSWKDTHSIVIYTDNIHIYIYILRRVCDTIRLVPIRFSTRMGHGRVVSTLTEVDGGGARRHILMSPQFHHNT